MPAIKSILLAAGRSTRFGTEKLLHPLTDGRGVAVTACANLRAAGLDVLAVVRPQAVELTRLLTLAGAEVIACDSSGMGESIARGVSQAGGACGYVIALADMPWIRAETICAVVEALNRGAPVAAPVFGGHRGHPVGFAGSWRERLLGLQNDRGARDLLAKSREINFLACNDPGVLADIDLPEDILWSHAKDSSE